MESPPPPWPSGTARCPLRAGAAGRPVPAAGPEVVRLAGEPASRRAVLRISGAGAMAATLASVGAAAWRPDRVRAATAASLPDIQFDIGAFVHPARTVAGVTVDFGVQYSYLAPAALTRTPTSGDQRVLSRALAAVEAAYPFSPGGIFTVVGYGLPYFRRLPRPIVAAAMPRLASDPRRFALEEAVPGPTDVSARNRGISKRRFNVPVRVEANDLLFTLRSDSLRNFTDVAAWLRGSGVLAGRKVASPEFAGLLRFRTPRLNFVQPGLPRALADQHQFPFATLINPASPMWMGFVDQQVDGRARHAAAVTFAGSSAARLTTARSGQYFDNGAIQHLSHVIMDLEQFYSTDPAAPESFGQRVQYAFRSKTAAGRPGLPFPEDPGDPFTNGGGLGAPHGTIRAQQRSAYLDNLYFGAADQATNWDPAVTGHRKYRVGHLSGLHRSSRAPDGTPLHIRADGPGLSSLDVPGGSVQPTLEFTAFVPTAEFFRLLRVNAASLDYVKAGHQGGTGTSVPRGDEAADPRDDGLERFLQATRRQNFLVPPRRHRSYPLLERA